jgi:hypothetical protein
MEVRTLVTNLSPPSKRMIMVICIAALVIMAGGAVFYRSLEALPFALGVFLTSALNVGKIFLLERTAKKAMDMDDPNTGKNFVRLQFLLRYFLTAAILLVAGLTPFVSVWGALIGIFTLQIAVISIRHTKYDENT